MLNVLAVRITLILLAAFMAGTLVATSILAASLGIQIVLSASARQLPPRPGAQSEMKPGFTQPRTRDIVPAPVIEPDTSVFIGTGDRSAGFWTRS
jgi:hypothetical protein